MEQGELWTLTVFLLSDNYRLRAIVYGVGWAIIETIFRCLTSEDKNGNTIFQPNIKGRTSWIMVPIAILSGFLVLEVFYVSFTPCVDFFDAPSQWDFYLRLLTWPIVIWSIELISGSFLRHCFGKNDAWDYGTTYGSCFKGTVKISYYLYWVALGFALEIFYHAIELRI